MPRISAGVVLKGFARARQLVPALALIPGLMFAPVPVAVAQAKPLHPTYAKAKRELRPEMYVMYRIVERLARANGLADTAWRVRILPQYNINAFAADANLIGIFAGIVDSFSNDNDAMACVIGHEMAHHTRRHVAIGTAQEQAITQQKEDDIALRQKDARDTSTITSIFLPNTLGRWIASDAARRADEDTKRIEQESKSKILSMYRQQEMEADELGYVYMARAGFDPGGCLRMLNLLSRTPGAELDTSHPNVPSRINAIQQLITTNPPASLKAEGFSNLNKSQPLTYGMSLDGQSLRIDARVGGAPSVNF